MDRSMKRRVELLKRELDQDDSERMGKMISFPFFASRLNYQLIGRMLLAVEELPGNPSQKSTKEILEEDQQRHRSNVIWSIFAHTGHLARSHVQAVRYFAKKYSLSKNHVAKVLKQRKYMISPARYGAFLKRLDLGSIEKQMSENSLEGAVLERDQENICRQIVLTKSRMV